MRCGNLITGQNPMSSALVAQHLIAVFELGHQPNAA
jgi:hypothetical protein